MRLRSGAFLTQNAFPRDWALRSARVPDDFGGSPVLRRCWYGVRPVLLPWGPVRMGATPCQYRSNTLGNTVAGPVRPQGATAEAQERLQESGACHGDEAAAATVRNLRSLPSCLAIRLPWQKPWS